MWSDYNDNKYLPFRQELRNNMTKSETVLWKCLRDKQLGIKFRRQFGIDNYILDFFAPAIKLNIEVDGITHFDEDVYHKDKIRDEHLKSKGIVVMRIDAFDVFNIQDQVVDSIYAKINELKNVNSL